jgi:hypothetical protein
MTVKRSQKKYSRDKPGELMLIHLCVECGKLSINRTAADDDAGLLLDVFDGSLHNEYGLLERMESSGIDVLGAADAGLIHARLLGWSDYPAGEMIFA